MAQPRVLFYVQHLLGIGHLARASRIAAALLQDGFDVTMVTGGAPVAGFPSAGIKQIVLPPITAMDEGFSGLADMEGNPVDDVFKARRTRALLDALAVVKPDILIIEAFPFGRRQMRFELLPLLEAASAAQPRPLIATSLRDILQERSKPGRNEETVELVKRFFDLVMVHGDPNFARLEETFPLAAAIAGKVAYTGLVTGAVPSPPVEHFDVLVSAGGGAAGQGIVRAALAAAELSDLKWGLITGPNLPRDIAEQARRSQHLAAFTFRTDFPNLLAGAGVSVSQAGYNTVGDLLRAGCRSVLVPFVAGGETEQAARAERLQALGLATVLPEEDLSPEALSMAVTQALAQPKPAASALDLDGAEGTVKLLRLKQRAE